MTAADGSEVGHRITGWTTEPQTEESASGEQKEGEEEEGEGSSEEGEGSPEESEGSSGEGEGPPEGEDPPSEGEGASEGVGSPGEGEDPSSFDGEPGDVIVNEPVGGIGEDPENDLAGEEPGNDGIADAGFQLLAGVGFALIFLEEEVVNDPVLELDKFDL